MLLYSRFTAIAALHSELLAVSTAGYLYQWCWTDLAPQRPDNPTGKVSKLWVKKKFDST